MEFIIAFTIVVFGCYLFLNIVSIIFNLAYIRRLKDKKEREFKSRSILKWWQRR